MVTLWRSQVTTDTVRSDRRTKTLCHLGLNYLFRSAAPRDHHRHGRWSRRMRPIFFPHGPHATVRDVVDGGGHRHARGQGRVTGLLTNGHKAAVLALVLAQALRLF